MPRVNRDPVRLSAPAVPAVQVRGRIKIHDDHEWLRAHVGALTREHEESRPSSWAVEDAPSDYIHGLLRAIVGFEISISGIEGKWKMSQNRSTADVAGVRDALTQESRDDLAKLIKG